MSLIVHEGGVSDGRVDMPARFQRSQDHHEAYLKLIRWELDDEMDAVTEKLQNWPQKKLEANGITIFNLVGKAAGKLAGHLVYIDFAKVILSYFQGKIRSGNYQ